MRLLKNKIKRKHQKAISKDSASEEKRNAAIIKSRKARKNPRQNTAKNDESQKDEKAGQQQNEQPLLAEQRKTNRHLVLKMIWMPILARSNENDPKTFFKNSNYINLENGTKEEVDPW